LRWADYFSYKEDNYEKMEHYFAKLIYLLAPLSTESGIELSECYYPAIPEEEFAAAKRYQVKKSCVSHDAAADILKKVFGKNG
jgi:hypothetical protein